MEPQSIQELAVGMRQLRERGLVESGKKGPQGVGETLRAALNMVDLSEGQSRQQPDLGIGVKVKGTVDDSKTPVTLFTKSPENTVMPPRELLRQHGTKSDNPNTEHDLTLYKSPSADNNDFDVDVVDGNIRIITPDGDIYGQYSIRDVREALRNRYRYLMVAVAESKSVEVAENPLYRYYEAKLYHGLNLNEWERAVVEGDVIIEFRMACHEDETVVRDRGIGWRMYLADLVNLYDESHDLLEADLEELPPAPQRTLRTREPDEFAIFD